MATSSNPSPAAARAAFAGWRASLTSWWDDDPHLASLLRHHVPDAGTQAGAVDALRAFAAECAGPLDRMIVETNRDEHLPQLRRWDGHGNRIEEVVFHPDYHAIGRAVYRTGVMSRYATPGRELETLGLTYVLAQGGEGGHCCPLACTAGMIKILQAAGTAPEWLERLYDPDYDTHFHASQFLTEVQGGSDVGANALVAREADGGWTVTGEKWFCSVIDAHLFLVTARPEGADGRATPGTAGLATFVVPRRLPAPDGGVGTLNHFEIRRLKYKLGTRSMASAEVDFRGAVAVPVGDFRRAVEIVLNTSRVYNAISASGLLQRAWREADGYARARTAFGSPILAFPSIARTVARLKVEAYAARSVSFLLAATIPATGAAPDPAWRMLVNLNKIWTAQTCPAGMRDAIEVLGGNGAIEDFSVLPRLLRDSLVLEAWEGGHGVLCAQILRDARKLQLHEPMFAWLEALGGATPQLAEARARWARLLALPEASAAAHVRDLVEELRPIAQAAALAAEARTPGSDPLLPVVIEHLLVTTRRGWDPLDDLALSERIAALVAPVGAHARP
ncbi:MAG: acyl-CoA dehydrogenase family protein [Pseudomonadota bacterium]|nr:acyl-CoA dehydrogenase family protein [Pseudomonadota bacterium]